MTVEDGGDDRMIISPDDTPVPHEANDMAPGAISELDARASFERLMRFASRRTNGTGASYAQGVMMAFEELGWNIALWSDDD